MQALLIHTRINIFNKYGIVQSFDIIVDLISVSIGLNPSRMEC